MESKVLILSGYYVQKNAQGKFKCDICELEKPWEGENFEIIRCLNKTGRCNGRMHLVWGKGEEDGKKA